MEWSTSPAAPPAEQIPSTASASGGPGKSSIVERSMATLVRGSSSTPHPVSTSPPHPYTAGNGPAPTGNNFPISTKTEDPADYSDTGSEEGGWIDWFVNYPGNEYFCAVDEDYIRDNFNLYGLQRRVQYYDYALEMILGNEPPTEEDLNDADFLEVYRDAQELYGLIHARFICSVRGLQLMRCHFLEGRFGRCPRYMCGQQLLLPVGTSEDLRVGSVKMYCPRCGQAYEQRLSSHSVDGAFFGTSFPHIFCLRYPELIPTDPPTAYVAKLFGFRVHGGQSVIEQISSKTRQQLEEYRACDAGAVTDAGGDG